MGGSARYSNRRREVGFGAAVTALAWCCAGCATVREGLDPGPFLAGNADARRLERAAHLCMSDGRCPTSERIAAWQKVLELFPSDGLRLHASLGLALALIAGDRLIEADDVVASLTAANALSPPLRDGLELVLAALDNRRERPASALRRLDALEGRFIDPWLTVLWTRERVLAFRRAGRSEEALRAISAWVSRIRDDSPELLEARQLTDGFDDVAVETYLRVRSARPKPEPIAPAWLLYLVDRVAIVTLRERHPLSAQWLLENPLLSARLRPAIIDALRLLASELGRRGGDDRVHAVVVIQTGDETVLRRALAFTDGLARQTASLADKLMIETVFLDATESLERRLGRGAGTDVLIGAFASSELPMLAAFAETRSIPAILAVGRPPDAKVAHRLFFAGLESRAATEALLAARQGPLRLACIGAECTYLEPLFRLRESGGTFQAPIFVRGPVNLSAAFATAAGLPTVLALPDETTEAPTNCSEVVTLTPVYDARVPARGDWWFDLGGDVGAFLVAAAKSNGPSEPVFTGRLQSATISSRTAEVGRFDETGALVRSWKLLRIACDSKK